MFFCVCVSINMVNKCLLCLCFLLNKWYRVHMQALTSCLQQSGSGGQKGPNPNKPQNLKRSLCLEPAMEPEARAVRNPKPELLSPGWLTPTPSQSERGQQWGERGGGDCQVCKWWGLIGRRKEVEDVASGWSVRMEVAYLDANWGLTKLWSNCVCVAFRPGVCVGIFAKLCFCPSWDFEEIPLLHFLNLFVHANGVLNIIQSELPRLKGKQHKTFQAGNEYNPIEEHNQKSIGRA